MLFSKHKKSQKYRLVISEVGFVDLYPLIQCPKKRTLPLKQNFSKSQKGYVYQKTFRGELKTIYFFQKSPVGLY